MIIMSHLFDTEKDLEKFKVDFLTIYDQKVIVSSVNQTLVELKALEATYIKTNVVFLVVSNEPAALEFLCKKSKAVGKYWLEGKGIWQTEIIKPYVY